MKSSSSCVDESAKVITEWNKCCVLQLQQENQFLPWIAFVLWIQLQMFRQFPSLVCSIKFQETSPEGKLTWRCRVISESIFPWESLTNYVVFCYVFLLDCSQKRCQAQQKDKKWNKLYWQWLHFLHSPQNQRAGHFQLTWVCRWTVQGQEWCEAWWALEPPL